VWFGSVLIRLRHPGAANALRIVRKLEPS
jgi:hypothetical protein